MHRPWIGDEYAAKLQALRDGRSMNGVLDRVLLLGESHYGDASDDHENFTVDFIQDPGDTTFLTKILQVYAGEPASEIEHNTLLREVAFANYIQDLLPAPRAIVAPTQWSEAENGFRKLLADTCPSVLICFGRRLWDNLPTWGRHIPLDLAPDDKGPTVDDAWIYEYESEKFQNRKFATIAIWVYHPSSFGRFSWQDAYRRAFRARMFHSNVMVMLDEGEI